MKLSVQWDEWRGDVQGNVTMLVKHLILVRGRKVDLHKFVGRDAPGCFHTHPAPAIRVILWGGYIEELESGALREWKPGMVGTVRPELSHRIVQLRYGRCSYSLWLRGMKCSDIQLRGPGWDDQ